MKKWKGGPRIKEDLIPKLYRYGKATKQPMTKIVDSILREYLSKVEILEEKVVRKENTTISDIEYKIVANQNARFNDG